MTKNNVAEENQALSPREAKEEKLAMLKEKGVTPYPHKFERTHMAGPIQEKYADLPDGTETEDHVAVAGRIMSMRNNGMFIDLQDASGKIQLFCHKDSMDEEKREMLKLLDIGDVIGAHGTIRRTPRGELSVRTSEITMLTKSLEILPEKHHGLKDIEQRYRQRYVDLIVNEESRERLRTRSKVVKAIRDYMDGLGAMEVETPMLHPIMGGASAKPFETHHNALDAKFYLRVAPELYLKRLIVGGFADAVYEIGRCFRNEGLSIKHNPEFTSIEGYHAYYDYNDLMDLIEDMCRTIVQKIHGSTVVKVGDHDIDFGPAWPRKTMCELVKEKTGLDFLAMKTDEEAQDAAKSIGVSIDPKAATWGKILQEVFDERVEDTLIQPTHVMDVPLEVSPLAKGHRENERLVERFESFINGWEIANAFTELNDPAVQRERFQGQVDAREAGDEEAQMLDEDFVTALEFGLPPTGGWGLGIDRFVMLLTDASNIRDVICFPTLKPKQD